jgi:DNA-binding response OmpR family regulator
MRARRASADKQPEAETAPERCVSVILDERASQIADALQAALGAGFHVVALPPADDVIAVLNAASPRLVAAHRQLHPTVGLIVTEVGAQPNAVAAILDAGADDCLRATDPRELAARLAALSRRRALNSVHHPYG